MPDEYTISVNSLTYKVLTKMRNNLTKQIGDKATYNLVLKVLLKEHYSLPGLKQEITKKEEELHKLKEKHSMFMEKLLLDKSKQPVVVNGNISSNSSLTPPPPPPSSKKKPLKKIKQIDLSKLKTPNEVKQALQDESKQVFDGVMRKPSEILAMTSPKHKDATIKEIEKEQIIDLEKKSSVMKNPDFYKLTEKDVQYVM